jgi:hypothetical protein
LLLLLRQTSSPNTLRDRRTRHKASKVCCSSVEARGQQHGAQAREGVKRPQRCPPRDACMIRGNYSESSKIVLR